MCSYSPLCKCTYCCNERHHWLEIKVLAGPISQSEANELLILRSKGEPLS